ncbi:MAG: sulfite exporter TauE/SafE family protein [Xanthobacteraceae bacterium]|nr:sulfite exporter TauE/SafE family protein [Xanthobacteraceae bacterium]
MTAILLAFFAGTLTVINPCILPLLPVVVAAAFANGKFGAAALLAGLVAGFATLGVLVNATGALFGIGENTLRITVAILLLVFAAVLLVPPLERRFSNLVAPVGAAGANLAARAGNYGIAGQFAVGILLGAIWAPCSGPSVGAALSLAAEAGGYLVAAARMTAFALGAALVLFLVAIGARSLANRNGGVAKIAPYAKKIAGGAFLVVGLLMLTGFDRRIEAVLVDLMPDWLVNFTTRF